MFWSIATALAGFAPGYRTLLAARTAVGIGEASFGTVSPGLLADFFPREWRGRVLSWFYLAIPVGSALGYLLGGGAQHRPPQHRDRQRNGGGYMSRVKLLNFISVFVLLFFSTAYADTYIPIDSLLYNDFRLLEAEGLITTSQLATLPISRLEGARLTAEALNNAATGNSPRIDRILARLQKEFVRELDNDKTACLKPDTANLQYVYSDGKSFFAQKNRDGVEVRRGNSAFLDLTSRFDSRYVGLVVKPELNIYDDTTQFTLKKAYLLANVDREEFMVGKESAWWGPGQNGSILLSTNAEPLTTLKISNSGPYFPFGIGVRGTFFITQLENDRKDVRRPILHGIRLDFKPTSFIEFGLSRTAMFGGKGRKEDFATFARSFFVVGENDPGEPGDQRAGYDVKIVLPWRPQPATLYLDAAGEDQRHSLPSKWFYLYGIYLPRVLSLSRLELWGEYAANYDSTYPGVWYTHHVYTQGYTYNERIIGHYIGSDAKDLFLQSRYNFDAATVTVSYERLQKLFPVNFTRENYQVTVLKQLTDETRLTFSAGYSREASKNIMTQIALRHEF